MITENKSLQDNEMLEAAGKLLIKLAKSQYEKEEKKDENEDEEVNNTRYSKIETLISDDPPEEGASLESIFDDIENIILPSHTLWKSHHTKKINTSTTNSTYVGNILTSNYHGVGFNWYASPAVTEVENTVCDWLVDFFNLDDKFKLETLGGGALMPNMETPIVNSVINARYKKIRELKTIKSEVNKDKLVAYYTNHSFQNFKKVFNFLNLENYKELSVTYNKEKKTYEVLNLKEIIEEDIKNGLIPYYIGSTFSSQMTGDCDDLETINTICQNNNIFHLTIGNWKNNFLCLKENKVVMPIISQLKKVNSLVILLDKLLVGEQAMSAIFTDDRFTLNDSFAGKGSLHDPKAHYILNKYSEDLQVVDYKDWQIGMFRPFESIKVWISAMNHGSEILKNLINSSILQGKHLVKLINQTPNFEIHTESLGVITFRYTGHSNLKEKTSLNELNNMILEKINLNGKEIISYGKINQDIFLKLIFCPNNDENNYKDNKYINVENIWKLLTQAVYEIELQLKSNF